MATLLHHQARGFETQVLDRLGRRLAGLGVERAAELARTEMGGFGKFADRQFRGEIALRIGQRTLDTVRFGLQLQQRGELRLPAGTPVIDHKLLRHGAGDVRTMILLDHGKRQIDARGRSGRGPHGTIHDEDAVFLHLHVWKPRLQITRVVPMRGRTSAFQ